MQDSKDFISIGISPHKGSNFVKTLKNQMDLIRRNSQKVRQNGQNINSWSFVQFLITSGLIALVYYIIIQVSKNNETLQFLNIQLKKEPHFTIPHSALESLVILKNQNFHQNQNIRDGKWTKAQNLQEISQKIEMDLENIRKFGGIWGDNSKGLIHTVQYNEPSFYNGRITNVSELYNFGKKFYNPWFNQSTDGTPKICKNFSIGYAKPFTFKPRALVSIPGSGVNWIRYLIEAGSGILTGSVHNDPYDLSLGFHAEFYSPVEGNTILQRYLESTSFNQTTDEERYYLTQSRDLFEHQGILLVRNPFKSIIIYWLTLELEHEIFPHFVQSMARKWRNLIISWIGQGYIDELPLEKQKLLIVQYEQVKLNPEFEIRKMLTHLGLVNIEPDRLSCLLKNLDQKEMTQNENIPNSAVTRVFEKVPVLTSIIQDQVESVNKFLKNRGVNLYLNYTVDNLIE